MDASLWQVVPEKCGYTSVEPVFGPAEYLSADAGYDSRRVLGTGDHDTADIADGGRLRNSPHSSRHHFPRQHADRLLYTTGRDEPFHRQLPLPQTGHRTVYVDHSLHVYPDGRGAGDYLLAGTHHVPGQKSGRIDHSCPC